MNLQCIIHLCIYCIVAQLFHSKFKRHLKLNQMAQTTLAVLQHPSNFESMRSDWDTVDFESIMEQATWVCNCNREEVQHLCKYLMWGGSSDRYRKFTHVFLVQNGIRRLLYSEAGLHDWIVWIQGAVEKYVSIPEASVCIVNHSTILKKP